MEIVCIFNLFCAYLSFRNLNVDVGMEYASQATFFYGRSGILRYTIQNMIKIGPYCETRFALPQSDDAIVERELDSKEEDRSGIESYDDEEEEKEEMGD